jgi:hypothetical protein
MESSKEPVMIANIGMAVARVLVFLCFASVFQCFAETRVSDQELASRAREYMDNLVQLDHFSGSVLLARDGRVLLSKG